MSVRKQTQSLNSSCAHRMCVKHPQRLATHAYASKGSNPDTFYCEKCSIMLASQGYNVVKINTISSGNSKKPSLLCKSQRSSKQFSTISNRKNQISTFVESLQSIFYQLERKMEIIQEYLIKSESQHGRLIEQANNFYKEIEEMIELQKFTTYNSILNKRSMEEAQIREFRELVSQSLEEIQTMMNDISENMDAVETVDYSIYNTIMGGYQNKIQKAKQITREQISLKPIEKCTIILPQIPKSISTLSDKISLCFANKSNSHNNSMIGKFKPQRIAIEDACMSEQSQSQEQFAEQYQENIKNMGIKRNFNELQPPMRQTKIIKSQGNLKQLAFSFDEIPNNSKEVKLNSDESCLDSSKYFMIRGFEEGQLSKIQQRLNSKQIYESRQSLGEYLNISHSMNHHSTEDTQTLLIA